MELQIKGKNLEISDQVRQYVERKIGKLDRFLPMVGEGTVELVHEPTRSATDRYVAQATLESHGLLVRGEERAATLYAAVDAVVDVLHRQLAHFKGKIYRKGRAQGGRAPKEVAADILQDVPEAPALGQLVRAKRFAIKPMAPEEAWQQMELLGHSFFFFLNADTSQYNVVYRRKDGNYGLIEPDLTAR
ncbi:MAG: ribosome-associated translation inhibitor RaiA [Chloroflexi bacterium]|nr:ribosome-associated translation inhibitor RaiA [Chloroflexota bacterium]